MLLAIGIVLLQTSVWCQQGDPVRGEALYVGKVVFSAGGAPCLACHGIAGHELGYAAGANYGPDLTALFGDYGEEGVAAVLEDPSAFESMEAIFADRPLTEDEIADLTAFFATVADKQAANIGAGLVGHAVMGTLFLMIIIGGFGWRRFSAVRRPLVEQARLGKGGAA
jgi:cytochrome c553